MIFLLPTEVQSLVPLCLSILTICLGYWLHAPGSTFIHFVDTIRRQRRPERPLSPWQSKPLFIQPINQYTSPRPQDFIGGRVVLITGAAGSIGSELVRQVLQQIPKQVILVDQAESALYTLVMALGREFGHTDNVITQIANVSDLSRMHYVFASYRPDLVFHAAAYKHVPLMEAHPYEAIKANVLGTQIVADLAVRFTVQRFVLISTDKAVNPTSVMGATKRLAEMYVQGLNQQSSTQFVVTRFGNVLDSSGSVMPLFREQIANGGPVTVTHPHITRYFMTIPEACQLVLESVVLGHGGEVLVFDMGKPVRITDLARQLIQDAGYRADKEIKLTFTGLRPGEKLHEEVFHAGEMAYPTQHPRICAARLEAPNGHRIQRKLRELARMLPYADDSTLIKFLQQVIPEYTSQNPLCLQDDRVLSACEPM